MSDSVHHVLKDGTHRWFLNGQLHREDGPAVIWPNGTQSWWLNGQRHRTDGPAIIRAEGDQEWWISGRKLTKQEFDLYRFRMWALEGELV